MSLFKYKPTSPGVRHKIKIINTLYKKRFKKNNYKIYKIIKSNSGRNNLGIITIRHKGSRLKRYYRFIDFFRNKDYVLAVVERIEYDPNRNSNICLIFYSDGEKRYILAPKNLFIGDKIISGYNVPLKVGNNSFLKNISIGLKIHCVESHPGSGAKYARSAGCYCSIVSKGLNFVVILMKSGVLKSLDSFCRASIGEVGNWEHSLINYGKAGCKRILGIRPTVRGVAMNPVDHPHGGGEGKTSGGRDPVSPWGKLSKSFKKKYF